MPNADLRRDFHMTRELGLKDHTDTFAMRNGGCQNSLNSMANTMAKIVKVAEASLSFIDCHDMGLHRIGINHYREVLSG